MIVFLKGDGSFCARVVTRVVERVGVCDRSTVRLFCVHGLAVHNELLDERASDCVCVYDYVHNDYRIYLLVYT